MPIPPSPPETNHASQLVMMQTLNQQIRQGLEKLHGPRGSFRSDAQELATRLALARDQDLIVVLPTGAGKSLVFQLPCQIEAGYTTVLIVPLKVLVWQFGNASALQKPLKTKQDANTRLRYYEFSEARS
jgi:superfamily II DNA or RNA helicase